jgi:hypothetical protein
MHENNTSQNDKDLEKEMLETIGKLPIDVKRALLYFMQSLANTNKNKGE